MKKGSWIYHRAFLLILSAISTVFVLGTSPMTSHAVGVHAKIPLQASLSISSVQVDAPETINVTTLPPSKLLMQVKYPGGGGFKKRGKTDSFGKWKHSWIVKSANSGAANVILSVFHGQQTRFYTLHFIVADKPTATPSAKPTSTPTATSTPTPTSTVTATPTSAPRPTVIAPPSNAILLHGLAFYTSVSSNGPVGTPQTSFPSTTPTINGYASFSNWQGYHEVTFNWYDPSGTLYVAWTDRATDHGPVDSYYGLDVAGQPAADRPGQWTLVMVIDGQVATSQKFTIYAGTAPPSATSNDISLQKVAFYKEVSSNGPVGVPQTNFPNTTPVIYGCGFFSWHGYHEVTFQWYDTADDLYTSYVDRSTDNTSSTYSCDGLDVAGKYPSTDPGDWVLDIVVDGKVVSTQHFTITG